MRRTAGKTKTKWRKKEWRKKIRMKETFTLEATRRPTLCRFSWKPRKDSETRMKIVSLNHRSRVLVTCRICVRWRCPRSPARKRETTNAMRGVSSVN
uniref:Uncharacterized protein n=1 Tax=Gasterosteus aculeatus TaxID=69293 RepID=G3PTJ8_GASAC